MGRENTNMLLPPPHTIKEYSTPIILGLSFKNCVIADNDIQKMSREILKTVKNADDEKMY